MSSLYLSDWSPKGTRKSWDRISIDTGSASHYLGDYAEGRTVNEAVGWFDAEDKMRVLVADLSDGWRIIFRTNLRGWSVTLVPQVQP